MQKREQTSMIYSKPTIEILGEAVQVIQGSKVGPAFDGPPPYGISNPAPPAYELDE